MFVLSKCDDIIVTLHSSYANAHKQAQAGMQAKLDEARMEVEEANTKVEQVKDQLATEMYNFVSKESDLTKCLQEVR